MERGFLSQKRSEGGRGVKEKSLNRNSMNTSLGIGVSTESDDTMNEDTPVGVASAVKEGVTPSVVDMTVEMEKLSSLKDTTGLGSFPPLSTPVTNTGGNSPGKSSYANVTGKPSGKKLNIRTLFTPGGNGIDVVVPVESIRAISERFANTAYGFFLGKRLAYPVVANYFRNTWGKYGLVRSMLNSSTGLFSFQFSSMDRLDAMLENGPWFIRNNPLILKKWHPDENLSKEDVSTVLFWVKLYGVPVTAFSEDGLSRSSYARVMIELRANVELKDNIVVAMPKITREGHYIYVMFVLSMSGNLLGTGEKKIVKKPSQTSRGVSVGPKIGFKPQKEYRHVPKKPTVSSSGNKKKGVEPTIEVPMGGTTNLINNGATSSGSFFMNVDNSSTGTTPITNIIGKFKELLTSGQAILVDEAGNPLKNVEFPGDYDSEDEVASVDNDMARPMASERVGIGTQSLLEQWMDSYGNGDYDDDPYDDDMYEGQDLSQELQAICDNLDIRVRGRKKK
ncbi:retrotransposon protein, putative, ty1-copia subclass [Tanacetum coccineum]